MKKKAALFISAILVVCLVACGADNNGGNQNTVDNTSAMSSEPFVKNISEAAPEGELGESGTETSEGLAGAETDAADSNILIAYKSSILY